ncbi:MAG: DNA polymerase III subunit delta [Myxococcota bacterium]
MTPEALSERLAGGSLAPAYLLAGSEAVLREDAFGALREAALQGAESDFDLDRFDAAGLSAASLADALRMLPVLAPRRLVVVDGPEQKRASKLVEALPELLEELPAESECVLVVRSAVLDKRTRWAKAFEKRKALVECNPPTKAREVAAFARGEALRQGVEMERGAAEALAERIGPQLMLLRQEIAKLALMAREGKPLSRALVGAGTPNVSEDPVWDLNDAIGEGRSADALVLLARLLGRGVAPPPLLGALASHFRRLLAAAHGGAVSGPPFVRKKIETQARRYGARRLKSALDAIHETDLAIKGAGSLRPELALERLVVALAR